MNLKSYADYFIREVTKRIQRHNAACREADRNRKRYAKRSGNDVEKPVSSYPKYWSLGRQFNPYFVRSNLKSLIHATHKKVRTGSYEPYPSLSRNIPKKNGGTRQIEISTIPDAAVSFWLNSRITKRNLHRLSSYAYAYRPDRTVQHAIENVMDGLRGANRLFVLEYDFSSFFDSICHEYLEDILTRYSMVRKGEFGLIQKFLKNPRADSIANYEAKVFEKREKGVPQGSSLSLFLSNIACFELDREIEKVGVVYARYADDTLILCDAYEKADTCAKLIETHGHRSGTKINFEKSPGISLITDEPDAEFRTKTNITFLAHSLSAEGVSLPDKKMDDIKKKISEIGYNNLLLLPKRGEVSLNRFGPGFHDWDLYQCINELWNRICGRISSDELTSALRGKGSLKKVKSWMSFYYILDDIAGKKLKLLDGWLLDFVYKTYVKRTKLLKELGIDVSPVEKESLISGDWFNFKSDCKKPAFPSFYLSWRYSQKCARADLL